MIGGGRPMVGGYEPTPMPSKQGDTPANQLPEYHIAEVRQDVHHS
jgi:hypothetical protein